MAFRFDNTGRLGKVKRTAQGGINAPATLTRTGILEYVNPDGSIRREYRSDAEVFAADSLETLHGAPVTDLHPPTMITPDNFQKYVRGYLTGSPRKDGDMIAGDLAIQDGPLIALIENGDQRNEVSCGYTCTIDPTPGVTPGGERYDARQTEIRYNHVALVPKGRAGASVSLRLDANDNQIPLGEKEPETMEFELIEGTRYEVGTDAHKAAVIRRDQAEGQAVAERTTLQARADALAAEVETLKAASAPEDITAAVTRRLALLDRARTAGAEVRVDMSEEEIALATVAKLLPGVDVTGKSAEFLEGAIASALANPPSNHRDVREDARTGGHDPEDDLSPSEKARLRSVTLANAKNEEN